MNTHTTFLMVIPEDSNHPTLSPLDPRTVQTNERYLAMTPPTVAQSSLLSLMTYPTSRRLLLDQK